MDTSIDTSMCEESLPILQSTPKPQQHHFPSTEFHKSILTPSTMLTHDSPASSSIASSSHSTCSTVRVPIPSPSRPRLDPRYAARLPVMETENTTPPSMSASATTTTSMISPPPALYRCENNIFRPAPLVTPLERTSSSSSFSSFSVEQRPTTKRPKKLNFQDVSYGDRFIPCRRSGTISSSSNLWKREDSNARKLNLPPGSTSNTNNNNNSSNASDGNTPTTQRNIRTFANTAQQNLLSTLMRTEVMGENTSQFNTNNNRFRFSMRSDAPNENIDPTLAVVKSFGISPVTSDASERLVSAPSKRKRRIAKVPFKVLDAPALQDDFYLNLVDWSSQNVLAVGLGACVYLWSACTSKVTKLCDLAANEDSITSVSWAQRGTHLAVGTSKGEVQLWDTIKCKKVRCLNGHSARVGTLAWCGPVLASGSRDRLIYLRDVRVQAPFTDKLSNHRQEVCGLRWSSEEPAFLASGGNDNNLHVIDSRNPTDPLWKFAEHTAAVKAIAWSPHQHGLLASGGGTADRCIRFWNTLSGSSLNKIDTGSQVCNIAWSQNCNEIVSTHGYSLNQIVVWRYPSMNKVATLTGHTYRVLYLAMSPDGSTVVTGAGDETLRFWQVFPGPRSNGKDNAGGLLFPNTIGSVIR